MSKEWVLPFATTGTDPEDVMLSERSRAQRDNYCPNPLAGEIKNSRLTETLGRTVAARGWGRGLGAVVGAGVQARQGVSAEDCGSRCPHLTRAVYLKNLPRR